jgi:phosphatidylinositol-3-phosphatase
MRWLGSMRIGRPALVLLACVSAVATVVIVHSGLRRTPAQTAVLAAVAQRRQLLAAAPPARPAQIVAVAPRASAPPASADAAGGSGSGGAGGGAGSGPTSGGGGSDGEGTGAGDASTTSTATTSASTTSTSTTPSSTTPAPDAGLPTVDHVFLITLSTPGYADVFGRGSAAPYLRSLVGHGTLLAGFQSLGHGELADELAMVSGQAPNADTTRGCPTYSEYPATANANAAGEVSGAGCVYPESALTIGDQVTSDGKVWGAYVAAMGTTSCLHPNSNTPSDAALPGAASGYDVQHNPFVFFHSVLDDGDCLDDDHDLTGLTRALARPARTPRFVYVGPDACADAEPQPAQPSDAISGAATTTTTTATPTTTAASTTTPASATPTVTASGTTTASTTTAPTTAQPSDTPATGCPAGQSSGIAAEDAFLEQWVPKIEASPGYRHHGVLLIAFASTSTSRHPVRTGALVLSAHNPHRQRITTAYGPYALLRSVEDMLDDTPLAHAATASSFARAAITG